MRTQTREAATEALRSLNNSYNVFSQLATAEPGSVIDLQDEYTKSQKALLKELHIKDRTDALRDPKAYFELIAWQFFERCYDRVVWSEARPAEHGNGHVETAHCAVFSPDQQRFPKFLAKITFHTQLADNGGIRTSGAGKPCMKPVAYVIESGMQQSTTKPHAIYRFSYTPGNAIGVDETEFMGPVIRHTTTDPETGYPDPLKIDSWMTHLSTDALHAIRHLEHQTEEERLESDHLAYIATHHLVHGAHFMR